MRYLYLPFVTTNMGLDVALYPREGGRHPEECAGEAYRLLLEAAESDWHWMTPDRRAASCVARVADAVERAIAFDGPDPGDPELAALHAEPRTWGRAGGPFPSYADAPAWEATGAIVEGGVAVVGGVLLASPGMMARGEAGPPPRAGVYTPYDAGANGSGFVRPLREGEAEMALAATRAEADWEKRWAAAWGRLAAGVQEAAAAARQRVQDRLTRPG